MRTNEVPPKTVTVSCKMWQQLEGKKCKLKSKHDHELVVVK